MPVESWKYKDSGSKYIDHFFEDYARILGGDNVIENGSIDDKYLTTTEEASVFLAGIKSLIQENQELRLLIGELKRRIDQMEGRYITDS